MPSGTVDREYFVFLIALAVMSGVEKWACMLRVIVCSL